jgi:hypothetical protein
MGGGAWPFLVGGVICLVNSDNERDLILLNRHQNGSIKREGKEGGEKGREQFLSFLFCLFSFLDSFWDALLRGTICI